MLCRARGQQVCRREGASFPFSSSFSSSSSPTSRFQGTKKKLFEKILIANRGEIACRVIRTAKNLGIQTVALYSDVDGPQSLHAKMADEAVQIGSGPSPSESYLRGNEVLEIASMTGAQAIHPGYGFLSENSTFATNILNAGIVFVGPPPSAILAMGSKSHSKLIMEDAGVPTTPGYHGKNQDPDYLLHEAVEHVGFPLLIKATMGGGGKGMRLVHNEGEFLEALESCKRESINAFGDDNVILERYLVDPRHIEVQVIADTLGNAVYLHERDCSLQRRHQKIIEEAPASDLPAEMRAMLGEAAVKAAKAVDYVNAGTVEFLVDSKTNDFFFCEMNTRLQVEHPITEMITGVDLVDWQLRVASGEKLPIVDQSQIPCIGHAFEARIYAENPAKDFLPATGQVWHHRPPTVANKGGGTVRVDTGIETGNQISVHYDPMISKLIVHGDDRKDALENLKHSLTNYQIAGVPSNIPFLLNCAAHPVFSQAGATNTGFLNDFADEVKIEPESASLGATEQAVCALVVSLAIENKVGINDIGEGKPSGPWSHLAGSWRAGKRHQRLLTSSEDGNKIVCTSNRDGTYDMTITTKTGDITLTVDGALDHNSNLQMTIDNVTKRSFTAAFNEDTVAGEINVNVWPVNGSCAFSMAFKHPLLHAHRKLDISQKSAVGSGSVKAPMPGKITKINFDEGDVVQEGDTLVVMEAMKMEHAVTANMPGVLSKLNCVVGDIVNDSHVLAVVSEDDEETEIAS